MLLNLNKGVENEKKDFQVKMCLTVGLCSTFFVAGALFNELRTSVSNSRGFTPKAVLEQISPNSAIAHTRSINCEIETYAEVSKAYTDSMNWCFSSSWDNDAQRLALERWGCQQGVTNYFARLNALPHY